MATTTPLFGWSVPTSSDLVKNGATAIETLGDSIDTSMGDLLGGTTGQVLAKATATNMDFSWVAQNIIQVVNATNTTSASNSTSTYATTGLTATITPTYNTSKILVLVSQNGCSKDNSNSGNGVNLRLVRGATTISQFATILGWTNAATYTLSAASVCYLDSPATTSATTYKTEFANNSNNAAVTVQANSVMSTITLIEVKA